METPVVLVGLRAWSIQEQHLQAEASTRVLLHPCQITVLVLCMLLEDQDLVLDLLLSVRMCVFLRVLSSPSD